MSSNLWQNYEIFMTADGSPTLISLQSETHETMHNRAGALSETDWIYGEATRLCFQSRSEQVDCFSLGLGLGYNELMFAAHCIQMNRMDVSLYSVESDIKLIDSFLYFLETEVDETNKQKSIYEQILIVVSQQYKVLPSLVKNFLTKLLKNKQWKIGRELKLSNIPKQKFHLIYYDAFSSKTSPHLWKQDFLSAFLADTTEEFCVFASYAATGVLKRTLKSNRFEIFKRKGFHGKRECTLAIRSGIC